MGGAGPLGRALKANAMVSGGHDPAGILEAIYTTELQDHDWLRLVTQRIRPLMDRHGLGMAAGLYTCPDPCHFVPGRAFICDVSESRQVVFFEGLSSLSPIYVADSFLSRACYLGSEVRGWSDISTVRSGAMKACGILDSIQLNVVEPDGQGCWFGSPLAEHAPIADDAYLLLTRIVRHLAAAHRLRTKRSHQLAFAHGAEGIEVRPRSPSMDLLSARERDVVLRALRGQHNKLIAHEMGLAHSTVRVLMTRAAMKLGARSRRELVGIAASLGKLESTRRDR